MMWDERFMALAEHVARWSKDPNTCVGCVLVDARRTVVSLGYNGVPRGVRDLPIRMSRVGREKDYWMEHAELNAIYNAPGSVAGCTAYVTHAPCARCARGLIQSQINRVVFRNAMPEHWSDSWRRSVQMFKEAEVQVNEI